MRKLALIILPALLIATQGFAEDTEDFVEKKEEREIEEFDFIGYYFMRSELSNVAPTNEFLKGQVVGRLFGGNTTQTSDQTSCFINDHVFTTPV
jgi:hypothetical protein